MQLNLRLTSLLIFIFACNVVNGEAPATTCWIATPYPCWLATIDAQMGPGFECTGCVPIRDGKNRLRWACNFRDNDDERQAVADLFLDIGLLEEVVSGGYSLAAMVPQVCGERKKCDTFCMPNPVTLITECWLKPIPGGTYELFSGEVFGSVCP